MGGAGEMKRVKEANTVVYFPHMCEYGPLKPVEVILRRGVGEAGE
jgi:hypothetical protein